MLIGDLTPGSAVWFWAAAATIIATLASVVSVLYKAQMNMKDSEIKSGELRENCLKEELISLRMEHQLTIRKLTEEVDECRRDREELRVEMARFETRLSILEKSDQTVVAKTAKIDKRLNNLEGNS